MKRVLLTITFFILGAYASIANVSHNQLVNIAGKQRMLSQKIAKVYLLNAYGANMSSLKSELSISKIIFERNLETLTKNTNKLFSKEVRGAVYREKNKWSAFKALIDQPASEFQAQRVLEMSDELLKICHDLVLKIKSENLANTSFKTDTTLLNTIDKSGKQRMLSQRLCLYFTAKKLDLKNNNKNYKTQNILYSIFKELDESLVDLLNAEVNSTEVEESIGNTMLTFENLRSQKADFLEGSASLNLVYTTTNRLTKDYDKLTSKYSMLKTELNNGVLSVR